MGSWADNSVSFVFLSLEYQYLKFNVVLLPQNGAAYDKGTVQVDYSETILTSGSIRYRTSWPGKRRSKVFLFLEVSER